MARKYNDQSVAPIIAIDFDGTITTADTYPRINALRRYVKECLNFLEDIGVKVVIYTSRDVAIDQDTYEVHDDITPMINFLHDNGIKFSAVNKSIQFCPFKYNARKVYAHMYVDDKAYGWVESACAFIYPFHDFLVGVCGVTGQDADNICTMITRGESLEQYIAPLAEHIRNFWV